jgi:hypothetical protein
MMGGTTGIARVDTSQLLALTGMAAAEGGTAAAVTPGDQEAAGSSGSASSREAEPKRAIMVDIGTDQPGAQVPVGFLGL